MLNASCVFFFCFFLPHRFDHFYGQMIFVIFFSSSWCFLLAKGVRSHGRGFCAKCAETDELAFTRPVCYNSRHNGSGKYYFRSRMRSFQMNLRYIITSKHYRSIVLMIYFQFHSISSIMSNLFTCICVKRSPSTSRLSRFDFGIKKKYH